MLGGEGWWKRTEIFAKEVSIFDWTRCINWKSHAFEKFKLQAENHGFQNKSPFFVESFSSSMLNFGCKMWFISLPKIDTNDDIRRRCGLLVPSSCKISSDFTWRHPPLQIVSYGNSPKKLTQKSSVLPFGYFNFFAHFWLRPAHVFQLEFRYSSLAENFFLLFRHAR